MGSCVMATSVVAKELFAALKAVTVAVKVPKAAYVCDTRRPVAKALPSPKFQAYVTLLPVLTLAVKYVAWPNAVGLELAALRPLMGTSVIVTGVEALIEPRLLVAVTSAVKLPRLA